MRSPRSLPPSLLVLAVLMAIVPLWSLTFLPPPWTIFSQTDTARALTACIAYWIGPILTLITILRRSVMFPALFVVQCLAIVLHALLQWDGAAGGSILRLVLVAAMVGIGALFADRDVLFPFLASGNRFWRRSPRLYANAAARFGIEGKSNQRCVVDEVSLHGIGLTLSRQVRDSLGDAAFVAGSVFTVRFGGDDGISVDARLVWFRDDGNTLRLGLAVNDPQLMATVVTRFFGRAPASSRLRHSWARFWVRSSVQRAAMALWAFSIAGAFGVPACGTNSQISGDLRDSMSGWGGKKPATEGEAEPGVQSPSNSPKANNATPDMTAAELERLRKELREKDTWLEALIKKTQQESEAALAREAQVREAADVALQAHVDALSERVAAIALDVSRLAATLTSSLAKINADIAKEGADLRALIADLETRSRAADAALADELRARIDSEAAALRSELAAGLDAQTADTALKLAALEGRIEAALGSGDAAAVRRLATEIAGLATALTRLGADIGTRVAALTAAQLQLAEAIQSQSGDLAERLRLEIAGVRAQLTTALEAADLRLVTRLAALERRVEESRRAGDALLAETLRREWAATARQLEQRLEEFKAFAAETYVDKSYLDGAVRVLSIQMVVIADVLGRRIDSNDAAVRRLSAELLATQNALTARIDALELSNADLAGGLADLRGIVADYGAELRALRQQTTADIASLRTQIAALQAADAATRAEVRARLQALADSVTAGELLAQEMRARLGQAVAEIGRLGEADQSIRTDLAALRGEYLAAIADEQEAREQLAQQVDQLATGLRLQAIATAQAVALAAANARDVARLRADLQGELRTLNVRLTGVEGDVAEQRRELAGLRAEMLGLADELREEARSLVTTLGLDVQEQAGRLAVQLGALGARLDAALDDLGSPLSIALSDPAVLTSALEELSGPLATLAGHHADLLAAQSRVEEAFVDAIDPVLQANGVDTDALSSSFAESVRNACGVHLQAPGGVSSLAGREWFFHLARRYTAQLLLGQRRGDLFDRMFGPAATRQAPTSALLVTLLLETTVPLATATTGDCLAAEARWSALTLLGAPFDAVTRSASTPRAGLGAAIAALLAAEAELARSAAAVDAILVRHLSDFLPSEAAVEAFLLQAVAPGEPGFYVWLARAAGERTALAQSAAGDRSTLYRLIEVAQLVNEQARAGADRDRQIALLQAGALRLEALIERMSLATAQRLDRLTQSQALAFKLIAALAARQGHGDIVEAALGGLRDLGDPVDPETTLPISCLSVQHFYNHATTRNAPVRRCESAVSLSEHAVVAPESSRCSVHMSAGWIDNWAAGRTWGNTSLVNNGWDAQGQSAGGGQTVGDGLLMKPYDLNVASQRDRAAELARRPDAGAYPADGESTLVMRIVGRATKFRLRATSLLRADFYPYETTVDAAAFKVARRGTAVVYEIPLPRAAGPLGDCTWDRRIEIVPLDDKGVSRYGRCLHTIHTFSPLVLNFDSEPLRTVNPLRSTARFDLDADGTPDATGWVSGRAGLLALDLDGNGVIDDGRELFGEATLGADGRPARNGYEALAWLDDDGDGRITFADAAYESLRVWFDVNQDGVSSPHELRSLAELGVTGIATGYTAVPAAEVVHSHGLEEGNLVRYESRFFGPEACGAEGCSSYDVYFGNASTHRYR